MIKTISGIFRNGKLELLEPPPIQGTVRVLVTFLEEPTESPKMVNIPVISVGQCPENVSFRREDMYGDDGR
jgi:hypothetical protein